MMLVYSKHFQNGTSVKLYAIIINNCIPCKHYSIDVSYQGTQLSMELSLNSDKPILWTHTSSDGSHGHHDDEESVIWFYHGAAKLYPGIVVAEINDGHVYVQALEHVLIRLCVLVPKITRIDFQTLVPSKTVGPGYSHINDRIGFLALQRVKRTLHRATFILRYKWPIALRRYKAGKVIASRVEVAAMNPYTQLCRNRLLREFNKLECQ